MTLLAQDTFVQQFPIVQQFSLVQHFFFFDEFLFCLVPLLCNTKLYQKNFQLELAKMNKIGSKMVPEMLNSITKERFSQLISNTSTTILLYYKADFRFCFQITPFLPEIHSNVQFRLEIDSFQLKKDRFWT